MKENPHTKGGAPLLYLYTKMILLVSKYSKSNPNNTVNKDYGSE